MKRLSKALAAAGVASRRACEELIFQGKVAVNGNIVLVPQTLVSWEKDVITVNDEPIQREQEKVYFVLNKPKGYICSSVPLGTKKLVIDLFQHLPFRLFTIGRLDRDTTGLLLVTNDGEFAQNVIHPSRGWVKEYLVKAVQEISADHLVALSQGCFVEGTWVRPVKVSKVRRGSVTIEVREGKKREVREMAKKAGLEVLSLHRIRIGPLLLGPLPLGAFRPLTEGERQALLETRSRPLRRGPGQRLG